MTPEQKEARRISTASGHIHELRDVGKNGKPYIVDKDAGVPYVFISYKSDDWETVLDGIVYTLCKKYGMRAYFDTKFEQNSDSWIKQFVPNMNHGNCKAIIAFTDNVYYESYATLMEVMASQNDDNRKKIFVKAPLSSLTEMDDLAATEDTGLGTRAGKSGIVNPLWRIEKETFDRLYGDLKEIADDEGNTKIKRALRRYKGADKGGASDDAGESYLTKGACYAIMEAILPDTTDINGNNAESRADAIYTMLMGKPRTKDVFDESMIDWSQQETAVPDPDNTAARAKSSMERDAIMTGHMVQPSASNLPTLREFLNKNTKNTFQSEKYTAIALVGTDGFKKYSLGSVAKAKDLVIAFANARIAEMGDAYIQCVTAYENSPKNPIFITGEEYARRKAAVKAGEKEQTQYEKLDCGYYMNKKYGDYDFLANSLKKQVTALDKDNAAKLLDNILVDCAWKDAPKADTPVTISADTAVKASEESKAVESVQPSVSNLPTLREFLDKNTKNTFQSEKYSAIALTGLAGFEQYALGPVPKAKDLVIAFANARIAEMGDAYIQCVTAYENSPKNPIFITQEEYDRRKAAAKAGEKEQTQYEKLDCGYYMNKKYGDYDFLANSLKKQVEALSEKEGLALLDNILVDCTGLQASSGMEVPSNALKL